LVFAFGRIGLRGAAWGRMGMGINPQGPCGLWLWQWQQYQHQHPRRQHHQQHQQQRDGMAGSACSSRQLGLLAAAPLSDTATATSRSCGLVLDSR
jgi:hypothetical protein